MQYRGEKGDVTTSMSQQQEHTEKILKYVASEFNLRGSEIFYEV